ncbi:MAG: Na/Pi symporter, partial [Oligosphaeraceae bacterium]|nr:Na/Pi symporter [Oligosphaeraceae bacterium]
MNNIATFRNFTALLLGLILPALLSSCSQPQEHTATQLLIRAGAQQMGQQGSESQQELQIEVLGPVRRTRLTGRKHRRPASEVRVKIEPLNPACGALALQPEGQTDNFGRYRSKLRFGDTPGDQYFRVYCPDFENVDAVIFHIVSGLVVKGHGQQTFAGDELPEPITVQVGTSENPSVGVPVFFKLTSGSPKASLTATRVESNSKGIATTQLSTAEGYTGKYEILVEVGDSAAEGKYLFRSFTVTAMALSRMNLAIGVLGGLALFIFGMTMMSDGLQLIAGNRLKNILQMFTGTRLTAVLAGLGITALIQSSSACSVMVVGFVNAGLLNLTQAIGVIFGSAIGTTVTAQMVSFKLDSLALPAICIGVLTLLLAKKSTTKGIATTVLGFGLLFFGMTLMSNELTGIADFPSFKAAFQYFDCTPNQQGVL